MAEVTTILQNAIISKFVLPFLLVFFIVFAILEKTKALGGGKQVNALVAFVIGLIFVSAVFPKEVVGNLILFLTVAIIVVFVALLLWGFAVGGDAKVPDKIKVMAGIAIIIAVSIAVLWAVGVKVEVIGTIFDLLFYQPWSATFWSNALFVAVIAVALALVIRSKASG